MEKELSSEYLRWQEEVNACIKKYKDTHPFCKWKKSKWKPKGRTWRAMYKEGNSPRQAANLYILNHEK